MWFINNSQSYVAQYSSVAKKQRSLSLQLGRRGYYGTGEDDRHGMHHVIHVVDHVILLQMWILQICLLVTIIIVSGCHGDLVIYL